MFNDKPPPLPENNLVRTATGMVYFRFDSDTIKYYLKQESVGLKSSFRYLAVKHENSSKIVYGICNVRVMLVARLNILNINQASGES